jgi:short subunit dehydrogenase
VVVNYRSSAEEAQDVVADITAAGGEAVAIKADVTVPGDVSAMTDETEQRWGRVDVLVHNALIPYGITSFAHLTWEQLGGKLDREPHVLAWVGDHFQVPTAGIAVDETHNPIDSPAVQALVRANQHALETMADQPDLPSNTSRRFWTG